VPEWAGVWSPAGAGHLRAARCSPTKSSQMGPTVGTGVRISCEGIRTDTFMSMLVSYAAISDPISRDLFRCKLFEGDLGQDD